MKDDSKDIVAPSKPPFAGKGGPPPRAFEAVEWPEESPPEMSSMLQDTFREWAKTKPDNPSQQESPYHAMAASIMAPGPPPPPRASPAADLQEKWRLQSQRRDEVRQGHYY